MNVCAIYHSVVIWSEGRWYIASCILRISGTFVSYKISYCLCWYASNVLPKNPTNYLLISDLKSGKKTRWIEASN